MENYVITIARGFGSGGRSVGNALSEKLGIPCYDKELLERASKESGISESLFHEANEKIPSSLFKFKKGAYNGTPDTSDNTDFVSNIGLFNYQSKILRTMAMNESFIIIGRAADYVLRTFPNVISINLQATDEYCAKTIMERLSLTQAEAYSMIKKVNKYRSDYYSYYTGQKWNNPSNYDMTLNTSRIGIEKSADTIIKFAEVKLGRNLI